MFNNKTNTNKNNLNAYFFRNQLQSSSVSIRFVLFDLQKIYALTKAWLRKKNVA